MSMQGYNQMKVINWFVIDVKVLLMLIQSIFSYDGIFVLFMVSSAQIRP